MKLLQRVTVKQNERGLLLRNGDFDRLLPPGTHWLFTATDQLQLERLPLVPPAFTHELAEVLMAKAPAVVAAEFLAVQLGEQQVGLRSEHGVLVELLPPGTRRLYWKGLVEQRLEVVELGASPEVPPMVRERLLSARLRPRPLQGLGGVLLPEVPEQYAGILRVDGRIERLLGPGSHAFWTFSRSVQCELVDLRLQTLEVAAQEILTRDKVTLRLNLSATWRYTDVLQAHRAVPKPQDHVYRELQFALRAAVGTRSLDELLANKTAIDEVVAAQVGPRLAEAGLQLVGVGVKDIILPGEVRAILAQVVTAEKAAEANLIRRREETAATRSLLNTAKVMEDNPVALRLKELETLERVAERIDKISVFGGLDQVLNGLVKLR